MDNVRVLVVGCGSIGKRHARLWAERPEAEVWVCDALEANLQAAVQQAPGARPFTDYAAALAERPDLVFICTPNHLHRPMAEQALDAGCHVLCEKPLADTVANAEALAERVGGAALQPAPDEAGRLKRGPSVFAVGYSLRSHAGLRRVLEIVRSGALGTLVGGRAMVGTYFTLKCATTPYRMTEPNALIIDYTHLLDYMRLFLGDAERVSAESARLGDLPMLPQPNLFSLLVRYTSGAMAQIHMDYIQHPQRSGVELYGDRGTVTYDFQTGRLQLFQHVLEEGQAQADMRVHAHHVEHVIVGRDDIYRVQIETFLQAVRGEETPLATAADGLAALKLAEAAVRAAAEGRAVRV
jgi:predicted dehydrogenase